MSLYECMFRYAHVFNTVIQERAATLAEAVVAAVPPNKRLLVEQEMLSDRKCARCRERLPRTKRCMSPKSSRSKRRVVTLVIMSDAAAFTRLTLIWSRCIDRQFTVFVPCGLHEMISRAFDSGGCL